MSIDKNKREEIDSLAEKAHRSVFGESTDYANLEYFLEHRGVDVRYVDSEKIDGYLRWDSESNCPVIAVSVTNEAPVRRRFTMAHELGHLILDWKWSFDSKYNQKEDNELKSNNQEFLNVFLPQQGLAAYRGKDSYTMEEQPKEEQANEFAAAFLIPNSKLKKIVDNAAKNNQNGEDLVNYTAWKFCTSTMTAKYRLMNYLKYIY